MALIRQTHSSPGSALQRTACLTASSAKVAHYPISTTARHASPCAAAVSTTTNSAVPWAAQSSAIQCQASPRTSSYDALDDVSTSYRREDVVPNRWSWQEDNAPTTLVELDTSALQGATSIADITTALQTAAAVAPRHVTLSPSSLASLDAAVHRLLPDRSAAAPPASTCSVSDAARLLEAYGALCQGAPSRAASIDAGASSSSSSSGACGAATEAPSLMWSVLTHVCRPQPSGGSALVASASARDLADLLWALTELQEDLPWGAWASATNARTPAAEGSKGNQGTAQPSSSGEVTSASQPGVVGGALPAVPAVLQRAVLGRLRNQDFLAPDLCRTACALGSLARPVSSSTAPSTSPASSSASVVTTAAEPGSLAITSESGAGGVSGGLQLDRDLVSALDEEIRFQLTEFDADFQAADLGRLITGLWGLRLGAAVAGDAEYRRILMKAVYGKTRSLVDKAAVDFALSRLLEDDPEARSMHYDSRWTHEELRWLPRRERDKRRIIKEGWYRTQWGGWAPGGRQ